MLISLHPYMYPSRLLPALPALIIVLMAVLTAGLGPDQARAQSETVDAPGEPETAEAAAGLQPQVTANVVVACSGGEEEQGEKLALLAALVGEKADVSCSQHATGLSVGGSWDAVMDALAACSGVLDATCALSVTLTKR